MEQIAIMFVDSHCHLDFPELLTNIDQILSSMRKSQVTHALCVSVELEKFAELLALVVKHSHLFASVGLHPTYSKAPEATIEDLCALAHHGKVVAVGETGLDYSMKEQDYEWQKKRFRDHIHSAKFVQKPLIIHTRAAAADTLAIMQQEQAQDIGGVIHCFTETIEFAKAVLDMGFYISFSGILTFKNAEALRKIAQYIPSDRLLIETDSPYLAPVPFRGKTNQPAFVVHVAQCLAQLRGVTIEHIATATTENFFALFKGACRKDEAAMQ